MANTDEPTVEQLQRAVAELEAQLARCENQSANALQLTRFLVARIRRMDAALRAAGVRETPEGKLVLDPKVSD